MNYKPGLTFYDFVRYEYFDWGEPGSEEWANQWFKHMIEDVFKKEGHYGDCTKQAITCDLCSLTSTLQDYEVYELRYDEWLKRKLDEN